MICAGHHLMQDVNNFFVSDLPKGVAVERNVVGFVKVYVIVVHVVDAVVVADIVVCV